MASAGPDATTTAVVVLGASDWPAAKQFEPAVQFSNSAHGFMEFVLASNGFKLDRQHLLDLFDAEDEQPVIVIKIAEFLSKLRENLKSSGRSLTDVITFYVGHGGFDTGSNSAYFLAIRKTNPIDYLGSSLSASSLRRALREHAGAARHYLILDCCFAAAAVAPYIQMSAAAQTAVAQVQESFPPSGTALLCAAGARVPARAKRDATYTMFSEGLLEILKLGVTNAPEWLTITELAGAVRRLLRDRYADEAVRPEVHCPEQSKGSVADVPLFRNARASIEVEPRSAESGQADRQGVEVLGQPIGTAEQFIREFQENDAPAVRLGLEEAQWVRIPEPVKSLLKQYEVLIQDRLTPFLLISQISTILSISVMILVGLYGRNMSPEISEITWLIFLMSCAGSLTILIWCVPWAVIWIRGARKIDNRTLRPLSINSQEWEKSPAMQWIRKPRLILIFRSNSYLQKRVFLRLTSGTIAVCCGVLTIGIAFLHG